ncbi:MAG: glycoside hydrolase family 43 protein [Eubacteriales bacterium]|nr:glycoside hydrolase family 43 protein [Eubacteriales bacterium]
MKIQNPILKGFHPDPSIVRVGEDYYLATSTFEWWPGVRLHHSRDLKHWELIASPLNRMSQLDLRGVGASQGIWAPCLTYDQGTFYLVYTVVKAFYCNMYDTENYLVTAQDIRGPWSEPVALNNFGFDPSLFHDEDGRKYMVSMVTDHRVPKKYAGRLVLQKYDPVQKTMTGPVREIYRAERIFLEGPHIFRRNGWYYLFSADTGTGEGHGQTIQRSRSVWGPYEMYRADFMERTDEGEAYSILTSRHRPELLLQKSGHCDLVETPEGEWYAVHLCGRAGREKNPADAARFPGMRRYPLGRETAIQKMKWTEDGWLVLDCGEEPQSNVPFVEIQGPKLQEYPFAQPPERDEFDKKELDPEFQSLRIPMDGRYLSLTARPGWLRLYGRSGLSSKFSQSLIAKRWTEFSFTVSTCLDFEPEVFKQMAGLILLYDTDNYLYLHVSRDEEIGKCISILRAENGSYSYPAGYVPVDAGRSLILKAVVEQERLQFYWGYEETGTSPIGPVLETGFLSDEACREGWFTGAMAGICCQDLTGFGRYADFDWFEKKDGSQTSS